MSIILYCLFLPGAEPKPVQLDDLRPADMGRIEETEKIVR